MKNDVIKKVLENEDVRKLFISEDKEVEEDKNIIAMNKLMRIENIIKDWRGVDSNPANISSVSAIDYLERIKNVFKSKGY